MGGCSTKVLNKATNRRRILSDYSKENHKIPSNITIDESYFETSDGYLLFYRAYIPKKLKKTQPLLFCIQGFRCIYLWGIDDYPTPQPIWLHTYAI